MGSPPVIVAAPGGGLLGWLARWRTFQSLGFREFRLLWLGQFGSAIGYWMDQVTRGWLMYDLTGSPLQLGLVTMVQVLPLLLLSPVAGTASDRYGRKTQLIAAQLLNAPPNLVLAALVISGHIEPWHLYATGLFAAVVQVFQQPARQAMVPESVDPARLTNAVGLNSIAFNVSRSTGPALAGGLIALVGAGGSYLVQAVMALLTAYWAWDLHLPNRAPRPAGPTAEARSFFGSTVDGWRYMGSHATIREAIFVSSWAQFFGMAFTTLLPVFARDILDVGPAGQGFLLTGQGLGALCTAFLLAAVGDRLPRGKWMLLGVMAYGVIEVVFSQSRWFLVSVGLMFVIGVCHVSANALVQSIIQGAAAAEMRGRVMGAWQQVQVFFIVGGLAAGAAAAAWGAPTTVALMGVACAVGTTAVLVFIPHARAIR